MFGTALIVIIILAILWKVKSKGRKQQKFERQASIRSSLRSSVRSRSNMTVLSTGTNKRRFDDKYSVSSSKGHLIDDDVSLSNISLESRSRGRERMDRSLERLDAPRLGSRDRLDQVNSSNGSLGMILSNGHTGSQHRLINGKGSFDRLKEDSPRNSPRNSPRSQRPIRATLGRNTQDNSRSLENLQPVVKPVQPPQPPKKAILPPVKPPQVRSPNPPVVPDETDGGYTDDGFSEHEFDDFTTTADEAEYSPNNNPNRVENQIESLRRLPNISEKPAYGSESSVDMDHRAKHPSNFFLPDNPPTPPPPLPLDSYPMKTMVNSPVLSDASSRRPTPQPRGRPVAPPRSNIGSSKESLNRSVNPLHLSQGDLNLIDKKPSWLNDQVRETSASESDSDSESVNDSFNDAGHKNKAFLENENLPQTVRAPGYTPPQDQSDRTDYSSPWRNVRYPSTNQSNSNLSRGSREMSNMDYLQGPYSNLGYEGSQENIPSYDEALNAPTNAPYSPGYTNSSLPPPYSPPSSQPFSPVAQNVHFLPGATNTQHPVYRIGSVNSIPMSGSDGLPRDIAFMDYRMGSQSTLPNPDGSMPDLSTGESQADLAEPDLDDMNDMQYQRDMDPFPQSPRGVPSYQQPPAQDFREPRRTRSREQLDRASPFTQRSRDSPVLYLDDQRRNQRRPEPIETEI